jgi:DNA-binding LacI/PurR family transcriptional regulator
MREKMKTVSILLMSCLIGCFAITGCSSTASSSVTTKTLQTSGVQKTTSNSATSAATSKTTTAESKASTTGKPTFKFGFIHTSFSDQIGTMYQKYAQYASNQLGCEITFSEVGSDSDKRMNALQNMIQVGCNGIIVSSVTEPMLKACEQSKVYLIMVGNSLPKALKDVASKNPYFIGAVEVNNYQAGYNMLSVMYDKGCRNVALLTWTPGVVETFDSRSEGMHDFLGKHSDMKVATEFFRDRSKGIG